MGIWTSTGSSIRGPQGPAGPQGPQGPAGPAGSGASSGGGSGGGGGGGWHVGVGMPSPSLEGAAEGDHYLDLATGAIYQLASLQLGDLPAIGSSFMGGFYAGLISHSADGVPTHALILAPRATGAYIRHTVHDQNLSGIRWKTTNTDTPNTGSAFDGYANTMAMDTATHPAAAFCRGLTIGGHSDWYMPALMEWGILYRSFKPEVLADGDYDDSDPFGANPYAVPPGADYTATTPARTALTAWQGTSGAQSLHVWDEGGETTFKWWTSTQASATTAYVMDSETGLPYEDGVSKNASVIEGAHAVRAIRRVPVLP